MRIHQNSRLALATLAVGAAAMLVPALSGGATRTIILEAKLKGKNEVPGPGDPNGRGHAVLFLKPKKEKICFALEFEKVAEKTAGHIHKGLEGDDGPIKVTLFEDASGIPGSTAEGCAKNLRRKLINRIGNNPQKFYVNLHNGDYPAGAIRGNLSYIKE